MASWSGGVTGPTRFSPSTAEIVLTCTFFSSFDVPDTIATFTCRSWISCPIRSGSISARRCRLPSSSRASRKPCWYTATSRRQASASSRWKTPSGRMPKNGSGSTPAPRRSPAMSPLVSEFPLRDAEGDATEEVLTMPGRVYMLCVTAFDRLPRGCARRYGPVLRSGPGRRVRTWSA